MTIAFPWPVARAREGKEKDWRVAQEGFIYSKDLPGGSLFSRAMSPKKMREKKPDHETQVPDVCFLLMQTSDSLSSCVSVVMAFLSLFLSLHLISHGGEYRK